MWGKNKILPNPLLQRRVIKLKMEVRTDTKILREKQGRLSYLDNSAVVSLLDVIAASIAEEFVERVKGNREVFEELPQPAPSPREGEGNLK
jgi:hypothetical protein